MGYGGRSLKNGGQQSLTVNMNERTILIAAFCALGLRRGSFGALGLPLTGLIYDGAGTASKAAVSAGRCCATLACRGEVGCSGDPMDARADCEDETERESGRVEYE